MKSQKFFFSSRRRHTRLQGDWSSDVCSSDLVGWRGSSAGTGRAPPVAEPARARDPLRAVADRLVDPRHRRLARRVPDLLRAPRIAGARSLCASGASDQGGVARRRRAMNVCVLSLVTVWHGIKGGMEVHGKLLTEGLARLGHGVTVVASRHPAGVEAETREGVRLRYARAGQFGSQRGAWAEECTRLVMALHREAPIDVLCCQQAVAPPSLLRFARQSRVPIVVIMEGHEGLALISELRQAWSHRDGLGTLPRRAAGFLYHHVRWERPLLHACDP